jgi:hypothetical protein
MKHDKKEYIDGIFNYCDRWCEKCRFTGNCRLFSTESKIHTYEILNDGELPKAEDIYKMDFEDIDDEIEDFDDDYFWDDDDMDFDDEEEDANSFLHEKEEKVYQLEELANDYMNKARGFLKKLDENFKFTMADAAKRNETGYKNLIDNFDIIAWYHMFIFVKIKRALYGKSRLQIGMDEDNNEFESNDMNGSAKIAAIAIKRSQNALNNFLSLAGEFTADIEEMMVLLGRQLNSLDLEFPEYKNFKRPGFDRD